MAGKKSFKAEMQAQQAQAVASYITEDQGQAQRPEGQGHDQQDRQEGDQINLHQIAVESVADIVGGHGHAGQVAVAAVYRPRFFQDFFDGGGHFVGQHGEIHFQHHPGVVGAVERRLGRGQGFPQFHHRFIAADQRVRRFFGIGFAGQQDRLLVGENRPPSISWDR